MADDRESHNAIIPQSATVAAQAEAEVYRGQADTIMLEDWLST